MPIFGVFMLESQYQTELVKKLKVLYPGCLIQKSDPDWQQGFPDLILLLDGGFWALLEVKRSDRALERPNQRFFVDKGVDMCFGAFIFPENEEEVLRALQFAYERHRAARVSLAQ